MERRDFIKRSCGVCAGVLGIAALVPAIQSCSPMTYLQAEKIENSYFVPFTAFVEEAKMVILKNKELPFNIALVKLGEGVFKALEMRCTHQTNALGVQGNDLGRCLHGRIYHLYGNLLLCTIPLFIGF